MRGWSPTLASRAARAAVAGLSLCASAFAGVEPVGIDLGAGERQVLAVTPGQILELRLAHRVPAASYQARLDAANLAQRPSRTSFVVPPYRGRFSPPDPSCQDLTAAISAWTATSDEAAVVVQEKRLRDVLGRTTCPLRHLGEQALRHAAGLLTVLTLKAGESARIEVERLDAAGGVARRWEVQVTAQAPRLTWSAAHEDEWIVGETARRLATLLWPGQRADTTVHLAAPGTAQLSFAPAGRAPIVSTLALADHPWSPAAWLPVARQLGSARSARRQPRPSLLPALADASASDLERQAARLSEALARAPDSPDLHEQAALVLAAFGLREAAGPWGDTRETLCAITAHLAFAAALADNPGFDARVAAIALDLLAGRERPAAAALAKLDARDEAERAWVRALGWRATADARQGPGEKPTRLERREFLRAVSRSRGDEAALAAIGEWPADASPEWARVVLGEAHGVGAGHALGATWFEREEEEILAVARAAGSQAKTAAEALREAGSPRLVLPWATWARAGERHLSQAAERVRRHLDRTLGDREAGRAFWAGVAQRHPTLAAVVFAPESAGACARAAEILRDSPERLLPAAWDRAERSCPRERDAGTIPPARRYFRAGWPRGTALDAEQRLMVGALSPGIDAATAKRARALLTYAPALLARELGRDPSEADFSAAYGALAAYHLRALRLWARLAPPGPRKQLVLERACAIEADECLHAGWALVAAGDVKGARTAFERGVAGSKDRIHVANEVSWLVEHYLDSGEVARARQLATELAEVGSGGGLHVLARLEERQGRLTEAVAAYRQIASRYGRGDLLDAFYVRQQRRHGKYTAEAAAALARLFPSGLRPVTRAELERLPVTELTGYAPRDLEEDLRLAWLGVREREQILAVDGFRVENEAQYLCVRSFVDSQELALVVSRGAGLVELRGPFARSRHDPR